MAAELARQQRIAQRPRERLHSGVQVRGDDAAIVRRHAPLQPDERAGDRRGRASASSTRRPRSISARDRSSRPTSPSTSRSTATGGSRCKPTRAPSSPATASSARGRTGRSRRPTDNEVLGTDGKPVRITPLAKVTFDADGTVSSDGKQVGKLAVVRSDRGRPRPEGLYTGKVAGPALRDDAAPTGLARRLEARRGDDDDRHDRLAAGVRGGPAVLKATDETLQRAISAARHRAADAPPEIPRSRS